jgi:PAS domain-containing protein
MHPLHTPGVVPAHVAQFYETDATLITAVTERLGLGLLAEDIAIIVATAQHRLALAEELSARGMDVDLLRQAGCYIELDAEETLARFMVSNWPDEAKFLEVVGGLVARVEAGASSQQRVLIFGEMVALLWEQGKRDATVCLEQLWNQLAERHSFFLMCGYPLDAFDRLGHRRLFFSICGEHSEINPAESYPAKGSEEQRRHSAARLQQKARALQQEIQISQERLLLLQTVSGSGTWELDLIDDTMSFSSTAAKLLGLAATQIPLARMLDLMFYSGDREAVVSGLQRARKGRKEFVTRFRISREGETRLLDIRGKTFYNGGLPLVLGVLSDVTPQQKHDVSG